MTPEASFVQAIVSDPDDDTTRLVYADWLEEHGDEDARDRADFLRLQIGLARDRADSPRRREQAFRARQLLDRHQEQWLEPYRRFELHDWQFARGCIEKVGLMAQDLDEHASRLFAALPIRRLWVTELIDVAECLARIPKANKLTGLDLCGNGVGPEDLTGLAALTNLGELRILGLTFTGLEDGDVSLLCRLPFFQRLSLIRCGGNPLSEEARRRLTDHFGPRVSFAVERDEDHLYAIQNERFLTGFGKDHTQILLHGGLETQMRLALFDHEGNLLQTLQQVISYSEERPPDPWQELPLETRQALVDERYARRDRARQAWLAEFGYQPATIRVKRFQFPDGVGIYDFPAGWTEVFSTPNHPEWETALDWLDHWLVTGKFAYVFPGGPGSDWWLDRAGFVTDT